MSYDNCTAAYNDGVANIPRTSPSYAAHLDADHDGVGCEHPPPGFVQGHAVKPADTRQHATTTTKPMDKLPVTGPGDVGIAGALVVALGVGALLVARRRKRRFVAG